MKSNEVLALLKITRVTLWSYVKSGKLIATKLNNGYYDYDRESVLKLFNNDNRISAIYCRVSTAKQKNDLETQLTFIKNFCTNNNIEIKDENIFKEIDSGIDLDRKEFDLLLDLVLNHKISNVYISYKDRLTRLSFKTLEKIFNKCGTKIIIVGDTLNKVSKDDQTEIFEELTALMHYFSTKTYSNRKNKTN
ncbi:MAG: transposase [Haloplasmataceae bacterium]|jgi:predicted site-specific integrase-resolvase|nr:transposase [Haloplasmataceae bacterium]